ncbi:DUF2141 domain-containing protein [Caenispirillum bisanense]|uniref:Uncharacterized conserved protein, DUF2141 family n=1 Tax=Caenispirillum bisanense TaxID=414052 RepID=A0A286GYC4_9PROT|nr:DUF2141 domain-containing protein [Caenispirillum bisanense]SOE00530.1 Uncharacterized conserved protein, DUF2141 family [Caenispirillum bisanense]
MHSGQEETTRRPARRPALRSLMIAAAALAVAAVPATAQQGVPVRVTVFGIHNDRGEVLAAVCPEADFLSDRCTLRAAAPAAFGAVTLTLPAVPPGRYAVQAFHDENGNRTIDRSLFGMPKEGMGFSNGAPMRFGPPDFAEAAVDVGPQGADVVVPLR